ncbi:MAG TPA: hypothetical protein VFS36_00320 [Chitinophagaceae bacterium]|jgi:hypothetical protein|nr:hypothetical protein [Chitinophagaceae bacterium]
MATQKTLRSLPGEKWKTLTDHKSAYGEYYAISSHGRLAKYRGRLEDAIILRGSMQEGYPIWRTRKNGENYAILIHRLVAKYFLPKPTKKQTTIIHLNYKKTDNHFKNLKWATPEEVTAHSNGSPAVKKARKRLQENPALANNAKLTVDKVKQIKKMLALNKTLKSIATKFGVSDMQVHRIKTGENWSKVKI